LRGNIDKVEPRAGRASAGMTRLGVDVAAHLHAGPRSRGMNDHCVNSVLTATPVPDEHEA